MWEILKRFSHNHKKPSGVCLTVLLTEKYTAIYIYMVQNQQQKFIIQRPDAFRIFNFNQSGLSLHTASK